jgi:hypothetical protein
MRVLIAIAAILAPALHSATDLMELVAGFSAIQLGLNYLAFLVLPFLMIGLYAVQRPYVGALALAGALAYGASFIYFAGTATYALARGTPDYATLLDELGLLYTAHGALMVAGGVLFGVAVVRARVLPAWTGIALVAGVAVNLLLALGAAPPISQIAGTLVRNVAIMGMGASLLRERQPEVASSALVG